ncbi:MAG: Clp protease N-terminal domain-containing protein, partial [Bacillota bacterium]|nr:Clp protease N-terminal domain-containing protein [Bacillota bacterium]
MYGRFTERAERVILLSQEEARRLGHSAVGTEHILLGLIREGDGVAARALQSLGLTLEAIQEEVEKMMGRVEIQPPMGKVTLTPRAKRVIELAIDEARQLGHNYVGTEHLLLGLLREKEGIAAQVLRSLGVDLVKVRERVVELLGGMYGG